MTNKFWRRSDDWYSFAGCFGVDDFTLPPTRDDDGPTAIPEIIELICRTCRVRPECAKAASEEEWNGVWVLGTWIPGHDEDRREAALRRQQLFSSFPLELELRGDDV
jgi:hypothetical protein